MIKNVLFVLCCVVVVSVALISMRADEFHVSRTIQIHSNPEVVFNEVNDLHRWQGWSPWSKLDPQAKIEFRGPLSGLGSELIWSGNEEIGVGRMSIVESHPYDRIRLQLEYEKPFVATNVSEFSFSTEQGGTVVRWSMSGHNTLVSKAVSIFVDCDKMLGDQFEAGLRALKKVSEGNPPKPSV